MSKTPFISGVIVGGIAAVAGGVLAGWLVTAPEHDQQVHAAKVDTQAALCASRAVSHYRENGGETELVGTTGDALEARRALAEQFAVALPGQDSADGDVVSACAHDIEDMVAEGDGASAKQS